MAEIIPSRWPNIGHHWTMFNEDPCSRTTTYDDPDDMMVMTKAAPGSHLDMSMDKQQWLSLIVGPFSKSQARLTSAHGVLRFLSRSSLVMEHASNLTNHKVLCQLQTSIKSENASVKVQHLPIKKPYQQAKQAISALSNTALLTFTRTAFYPFTTHTTQPWLQLPDLSPSLFSLVNKLKALVLVSAAQLDDQNFATMTPSSCSMNSTWTRTAASLTILTAVSRLSPTCSKANSNTKTLQDTRESLDLVTCSG